MPFLEQKTVIGRHPNADLQLESPKLALYHAAILNNNEKFYIESLDNNNGILIKNKKLKLKTPVQIHDGMQIDIPGYRLEFSIANTTGAIDDDAFEANELNDIPDFFYKTPPNSLLTNLIEDLKHIKIWDGGITVSTYHARNLAGYGAFY